MLEAGRVAKPKQAEEGIHIRDVGTNSLGNLHF